MPNFERVAAVSDIPASGRLAVEFDDRAVLVIRIGNEYYGIEDVCSHDGQPLTDGPIRDSSIECPRHGARFDLTTGRPLCMPAVSPIATYAVKVDNGEVFLSLR